MASKTHLVLLILLLTPLKYPQGSPDARLDLRINRQLRMAKTAQEK